MSTITTTLLSLVSTVSFGAAEMSQAVPADNQCRVQAKEIALQTYQTCVSESRTAKIEQIRKEYSEKIAELKKQYETQILELKAANSVAQPKASLVATPNNKSETTPTPKPSAPVSEAPVLIDSSNTPAINSPSNPEQVAAPEARLIPSAPVKSIAPIKPTMNSATAHSKPEASVAAPSTTTIDEAPVEIENAQPALKNDSVESEELTLTQPTIKLKPAKKIELVSAPTKSAPKSKSVKVAKKISKSSKPVVATKRPKGEKGVKGIAKTLPTKQKPVETKPASQIITENELSKTAPIQESELEKVQLTQSPLSEINETTGQVESLQVVDQGLGGPQAEIQQSSQQ